MSKVFLQKLRMVASEADDLLTSCDASDLLDGLEVARDFMFEAASMIEELESRLAQVERERDALIRDHIPQTCDTCKYSLCFSFDNPCNTCDHLYRSNAVERGDTDRWEFVGVCAENTEEE